MQIAGKPPELGDKQDRASHGFRRSLPLSNLVQFEQVTLEFHESRHVYKGEGAAHG